MGRRLPLHEVIVLDKLFHLLYTIIMNNIPTYDFPQSPILILGFFGILVALVTLYIANRDYFSSPLNRDKIK